MRRSGAASIVRRDDAPPGFPPTLHRGGLSPVHVGVALLTLAPGRIGGSETYLRGVLGEFRGGRGPQRVSLLGEPAIVGELAGGVVGVREVRTPGGASMGPLRAAGLVAALATPRLGARGRVTAGLDCVHYPLTVPVPRTRVPTVLTLHDLQHRDLPELFSAGERAWRRVAYDRAARAATVVIPHSEHAKRRAVDLLAIAPDRIETIALGIDHRSWRPDGPEDERLLADLSLPERYLVYPANLWPHKNHRRLLEALRLAEDRELALVLTGETYGRLAELREHASRAGVGDRVHHLGFIARNAMPAVYRRAVAMVFPSLYEGFGAPPLEAMACGLPVACSTRAALAEVTGDAAMPFEAEDPASIAAAIDAVATDSGLRARLRSAGLERAREFTWDRAALRHQEAYEHATRLAAA
jgi:glycosyltransferase involved in cell wall biosynthesis